MADIEETIQTDQEASNEAEAPKRGRRAAAERATRRRRGGSEQEDTSSLAVPEEIKRKLAAEGLEGRWINDLGNRMYAKTVLDDWDKVDGIDPVPVGSDSRTGKPVMAYYCAKPKEFLAEDNRKRIDRIKAKEQAVFTGRDNGEMDEGAYQPKTSNYIGRRAPG